MPLTPSDLLPWISISDIEYYPYQNKHKLGVSIDVQYFCQSDACVSRSGLLLPNMQEDNYK